MITAFTPALGVEHLKVIYTLKPFAFNLQQPAEYPTPARPPLTPTPLAKIRIIILIRIHILI